MISICFSELDMNQLSIIALINIVVQVNKDTYYCINTTGIS